MGKDVASRSAPATTAGLYRWGLLVARRRRLVIGVWAALVAVGLAFIPRFMSHQSMGAGIWVSGTDSSRAAALLARDLPATGGQQAMLVFSSETLRATDPAFDQVITVAARNVSAVKGVSGTELPRGAAAPALVAPDERTALAVVALRGNEAQAMDEAAAVGRAARAAGTVAVRVGATGEPVIDKDGMVMEHRDIEKPETVGVPVALIVLLAMFGSLVAAGLPLLLASSAVVIAQGGFGAYLLVAGGILNSGIETVTLLLGLGVGTDYALFVVTRFREELSTGKDAVAAAATATATAGHTVIVSGSTVVVALAPLMLINDGLMRQVAIGPMVAVTILVAAASSLLPAALAGLGTRVDRLAPPLPAQLRWSGRLPGRSRLTALALGRPVAVLISGVIILGGLSTVLVGLRSGFDYGLNSIRSMPSGQADAAISAAFGPGAIAPTQVVLTTGGGTLSGGDLRAIDRLGATH